MSMRSEILAIVDQFFAIDLVAEQSKICSPELRSVMQATCVEHEFSPALRICLKCGMTMEEHVFNRPDESMIMGN